MKGEGKGKEHPRTMEKVEDSKVGCGGDEVRRLPKSVGFFFIFIISISLQFFDG